MDLFSAISDPTRRNIIEILASEGKQSATNICKNFNVTPAAISQHLKILRDAKLIEMEKQAQMRIYKLNQDSIMELEKWTRQITQRWNEPLKALEQILKVEKERLKK